MSLLSKFILPMIEKQLVALEPQIATLIVQEIQQIGDIVIKWVDDKAHPAALITPVEHKD